MEMQSPITGLYEHRSGHCHPSPDAKIVAFGSQRFVSSAFDGVIQTHLPILPEQYQSIAEHIGPLVGFAYPGHTGAPRHVLVPTEESRRSFNIHAPFLVDCRIFVVAQIETKYCWPNWIYARRTPIHEHESIWTLNFRNGPFSAVLLGNLFGAVVQHRSDVHGLQLGLCPGIIFGSERPHVEVAANRSW